MAQSPSEYDYLARGQFYLRQGNAAAAIEDFDQALTLKGDLAPAYYYRGLAHRNVGNPSQAIADYTEAIALEPDYPVAFYARGVVHRQLENYDAAIHDYDQAILLEPEDADFYYARGVAHASLKNYEAAIADFRQAVDLNPEMPNAYYNLGIACRDLGRREEALEYYSTALKLRPNDADYCYARGNLYSDLHQYEAAIADYDRALSIVPHFANACYNRGIALRNLGNPAAAIDSFNQAFRFGPEFANLYLNRGIAHTDCGEYQSGFGRLEPGAGPGRQPGRRLPGAFRRLPGNGRRCRRRCRLAAVSEAVRPMTGSDNYLRRIVVGEQLGHLEYLVTEESLARFRAAVSYPEAAYPNLAAREGWETLAAKHGPPAGVSVAHADRYYRPPLPGRRVQVTGWVKELGRERGADRLVVATFAVDEIGTEILRSEHTFRLGAGRSPERLGRRPTPPRRAEGQYLPPLEKRVSEETIERFEAARRGIVSDNAAAAGSLTTGAHGSAELASGMGLAAAVAPNELGLAFLYELLDRQFGIDFRQGGRLSVNYRRPIYGRRHADGPGPGNRPGAGRGAGALAVTGVAGKRAERVGNHRGKRR